MIQHTYNAETKIATFNDRFGNQILRLENMEFAESMDVQKALDRMFEQGVKVGKEHVRQAVEHAINDMRTNIS